MFQLLKYSIFSFIFIFLSCSYFQKKSFNIYPNSLSGRSIYFSKLEEKYKRENSFNKSWSKLTSNRYRPYHRFKNKKYTIQGTFYDFNESFIVIEDEKGRKFKKKIDSVNDSVISLPSYIFFEDSKIEAEKLIGKEIWLNDTKDEINFYTFSNYNFKRFEKVKVLETFDYQNSNYDFPIWLKVRSDKGEEAFVRFNKEEGKTGFKDHYYNTNPLPKNWNSSLKKSIILGIPKLGMTKKQVRVAIGNPNKVNITSSIHGISEQWIYKNQNGEKFFYQFDYETLTYISK